MSSKIPHTPKRTLEYNPNCIYFFKYVTKGKKDKQINKAEFFAEIYEPDITHRTIIDAITKSKELSPLLNLNYVAYRLDTEIMEPLSAEPNKDATGIFVILAPKHEWKASQTRYLLVSAREQFQNLKCC